MTSVSTIQETPSQPASSIVFTTGSTVHIRAPASKVFGIITDYANYGRWNTWTHKFEVKDGQPLRVGSEAVLTARGTGQGSDMRIPLTIIACSSTPRTHVVGWRATYLPSWFAVAERMHVVTAVSEGECEVRQWESMSGWGAWLMKYVMRIPKQLDQANLKYVGELKGFAEGGE